MILIGQYDSPFVRRVGLALTVYGFMFEHKPWSAFADAALIRAHNPLARVPTLVLDDGGMLTDSHVILSYLDGLMPPEKRLMPEGEPARRQAHTVVGLACAAADAAVSLFYELRLHETASDMLVKRRSGQIAGALAALESEATGCSGDFLFEERLTHADIAVAAACRFISEAHPRLVALADFPRLADHCTRLEVSEVFQEVSQPFIPPS